MRRLAILLLLVGTGALAYVWLTPEHPALPPAPIPEAPPAPEPVLERQVRAIGPQVVTPPPVSIERLERIAPREPLSPLGTAPSLADLPPETKLLYRPNALAAGLIEAEGHRIAFAGITVVEPDEGCIDQGTRWPCGTLARTAFRNWLRGRAIECPEVPRLADAGKTLVRTCTVGGADPALWLVQMGWARAEGTGPYADAQAEAIRQARGIHGRAPGRS